MIAQSIAKDRPEIIFGLVGQAGVAIEKYSSTLATYLKTFGYETIDIKLSQLLENYKGVTTQSEKGEAARIKHLQLMGLNFRKALNNGDGAALALAAIAKIRELRHTHNGNPDSPLSNCAFVLNQLKHPAEVDLLRRVYGTSFILLAGHAPKQLRAENLAARLRKNNPNTRHINEDVQYIIIEDEKQEDELGQNTRDTYPLADYFASFEREQTEASVNRFIDLLFGHPFHTPSPEEYAMYQAYSGSLRSSDISRQVGAVIVKLTKSENKRVTNVDVVASGMNEVPRRGGGFYWQGDSPDGRDQFQKRWNKTNLADNIKLDVLAELIVKLNESKLLAKNVDSSMAHELATNLLKNLKGTQFMNIGEFMRTVHAEMAALIDSARRGVAVNNLSMFVTTFPCHNCAKHIIAAGLERVVYLEPYPKSRAESLHGDEIDLEPEDGIAKTDKVAFVAFTGIAPRQYQQLFSMSCRSPKNKGVALENWDAQKDTLSPMYIDKNAHASYLLAEKQVLESLSSEVYSWDKAKICP